MYGGGILVRKREEDVPPKEEVPDPPESSLQLDPEILNCAPAGDLITRIQSLHSESDNELNNGEKPQNFSNTEEIATELTRKMALEPDETIKNLSGEESIEKDLKPDDVTLAKNIEEPMPEVTVGANTVREDVTINEKKQQENVLEASPTLCEETGEPGKNELDNSPSDLPKTNPTSQGRMKEPQISEVQIESSVDTDQDIYTDEKPNDIEKTDKVISRPEKGSSDCKPGVGPEVDIMKYCRTEWRGNTTVTKTMIKGYKEVYRDFESIRRIRGDNYCALRAMLFKCLSQATKLPQWIAEDDLIQLPEEMIKKYKWIEKWRFWNSNESKKTCLLIKESLELLRKKWSEISEIEDPDKKQDACDQIFQNEEEFWLYEAVKFLMLKSAIDLFNANEDGKEVPVFSWLLFARNTSNNPCEFLKNHLNHVGHSGGLEQVEMFLLGYALQHTIRVYRLYKSETEEFITLYPNDQTCWPVVVLITEDDRHYNVPVRKRTVETLL
ncbi:ubiquitin thioesterase otulin isoform X3 [Engystomops pustulosus]|uniref:ubiquitin thioesterase otulin isoform X3 n=1 Tax=Engystomops pustulosus TaxID=76066 RepID=UPI003AFB5D7C